MSYGERGGENIVPKEPAINTSQLRDNYYRAFFRNIDSALTPYLADDPLPLAIAGVDHTQAFFRNTSNYANSVVAALDGSYDNTSAHEIGTLIWPLVRESLAKNQATILRELNVAVGGQRSASTLGEVWRFAQEGRGATLVVEEGYHQAATIDERGFVNLLPDEANPGPDDLDDAVDEVITVVLEKGGRVVFVDDGTLTKHSRIALILRY